jgi:hypothetical protein
LFESNKDSLSRQSLAIALLSQLAAITERGTYGKSDGRVSFRYSGEVGGGT